MPHRCAGYTIFIIALLLSPFLAWSAAGTSVEYSSGRISIVAENATLSSVAEQLSKSVGASVYLDRSQATRKVSVELRTASLDKAMKTLVHPLNYAIVTDREGKVTELRIFRNAGLKESEYHVYAAVRPAEIRAAAQTPAPQKSASAVSTPPSGPSQPKPVQTAAPVEVVGSKTQQRTSVAGPSTLVTGEKAFQYSIWTTNRMMEAEQVRQSIQVKADQAEIQARETAAITSMIQSSSPSAEPQNTSPTQPSSAAGAAQASQQSSAQVYQQYTSQQRGFSYSTYYQQRSMRENYSYYSTYRGR